ncbi:MAG: PEP-CTERM sorting domain-containing protein [Candidatus Atribacteria bacterium]|nr:PEP-CTERM sorting domain-containing protein [Candidatus Atribacteria bacterium]
MSKMRKYYLPILSLILLFFILSTVASAAEMWPGWWKHNPKTGHANDGGNTYSVAEPTAILLLGAGLVSLAVYAKKKRGKKQ